MSKGKAKGFREDEHDTLWFEDRVYVPNDQEIRKLILQEAHDSPYLIHPGNTKMYPYVQTKSFMHLLIFSAK